MYPKLFGIEFLNTYGLMIAIGILLALLILKVFCKRFNVSQASYDFYFMTGVVSIGAGLLGAFLFQQLYNIINAVINGDPLSSINWGGITFMGGLVMGVATFVVGTAIFGKTEYKKDFYKVANIGAMGIVLAHSLGRFGCYLAGCCYGIASDSIFAVTFPNMSYSVLPVNLWECFYLAILFSVMMVFALKYKKIDFMLIMYGFAYSVWRFIIEFYRGDYRGATVLGLSPSQWQSVLLLLVTIALTVYVYYFKKIPLYPYKAEALENANASTSENIDNNIANNVTENDENSINENND